MEQTLALIQSDNIQIHWWLTPHRKCTHNTGPEKGDWKKKKEKGRSKIHLSYPALNLKSLTPGMSEAHARWNIRG